MLDESDDESWVYRRERRIQRPMSTVVRHSREGLPYLAPEIQLLYKSKAPRSRTKWILRKHVRCLPLPRGGGCAGRLN